MFSDMELGTQIFLGVLMLALLYFGGKNLFHNGGKGNGRNGSNGGNA